MPRCSARLTACVVLALGTSFSTASAAPDGIALYEASCAQCHGPEGGAATPVAKAMNAPALAGRSWDAAIVTTLIREDPAHTVIAPKLVELSDEELRAIAERLGQLGQ